MKHAVVAIPKWLGQYTPAVKNYACIDKLGTCICLTSSQLSCFKSQVISEGKQKFLNECYLTIIINILITGIHTHMANNYTT